MSITRGHVLAGLSLGLLLMLCPANAEEIGDKDQDAPKAGSEAPDVAGEIERIPYTVTIVSLERGELLDLLEASSQLIALKDRPTGPPPS